MKGRTFFIEGNSHLWFAISNPDPEDKVLIVNATSRHGVPREDSSCLLFKGDHSCITHDSYIAYKHAMEINVLKIGQMQHYSQIQCKEIAPDCLIKRIQDGAKITDFLNSEYEKYFDYFD